jgi:hypothetical protein
VSELAKSNQVELFFLLNRTVTAQQGFYKKITSQIKAKGSVRFMELVFYQVLTGAEDRILSSFSRQIKEHHKTLSIDEFNKNDITYLRPVFSASGATVRYPDEDINKVKSLNLDLIVRGNASGIFKGDIIKSAKDGIISFHHGDNRWNRGGPPAFWEVYLRKPLTGFIIQILTEELDGGAVLFRGNIPTRRSFTENIVSLYNESNPYLAKIILEYAASNHLPPAEEGIPFWGSLLTRPSFAQSISYLLRTSSAFLSPRIRRYVLREHNRWGVAFISGPWRDAILRKGVRIKNPPERYFADPFVVTRNSRTVCFVEDYSYKQKRGCIAAVEIIDKNRYEILGPVIEEPFHMSFPYLFEYQQELYMIPETAGSNSIRLYKCVEFPLKWEYEKEILSGFNAVDSMIFEYKGKWWLLTNRAINGGNDYYSQLMAYYSEQPLSGEWIAHERNPVVFDSSTARNGGILDVEGNFPIRCRQRQGFNSYGNSLTLARITGLTPSSFSEQEIGQILPNFFPKIKRCHHFHSNGKYTVYDYLGTRN